MNDAERIRAIAAALLDKAADDSSSERAAQLLKMASEAENQAAQAAKYAVEEKKLKDDLSDSRAHQKSEGWKTDLSILTPFFSVAVLAGTLVLQTCQYKQQHTDAANAAEDVRWNEAVKVLAGDKQLSPAGVLLASFSESKRYGDRAYDVAQQLLTNSTPEQFSTVFGNVFEPVSWRNLKWILNADRSMYSTYLPLDNKSWVPAKGDNDLSLLDDSEVITYHRVVDKIQTLGNKVGPLLKGQRPRGIPALDLQMTAFWNCDWKFADLSGADLTGSGLLAIDLDRANLSGITRFQDAVFEKTSWWNAATVSPQLLAYLLQTHPYKPNYPYGRGGHTITQAAYDAALTNLKKASSIP